jgi:transposase-like protein
MESIADVTIAAATEMPRLEDGFINLQEVPRQLAESVVNEIMSAEADQLCGATGNSRNGYRERRLTTCVGVLTLRIPKLGVGSFFPDDVIGHCQRVDRAIAAAVSEIHATGTSTRKVQKVARAMGIGRLSEDQVSAIVGHLGSEVGELTGRPLGGVRMPCLWIDATYVRCGRDRRVASTAVVTAIGRGGDGWRHVLGPGVADTESYDSWLAFPRKVKARGVEGDVLVTSDALAHLGFPAGHWKRLRTNNVQERANRGMKRGSRVVQVFPSV